MSRTTVRRRRYLALLGVSAAGIAGCSGDEGASGQTKHDASTAANTSTRVTATEPSSTSETTTATETTSETETPSTTDRSSPRMDGANVPTYPYRDTETPPLTPVPAEGADNPVLAPEDVTDGDALFVADPFLFHDADDTWHLFFEVLRTDLDPNRGVVSHATSDDGLSWDYQGTVIEEPYHLSFPMAWKWQGEYYMSPNGEEQPPVYRATQFPNEWERIPSVYGNPDAIKPLHDHAFFRWNDKWWLIGNTHEHDTYLYYNDSDSIEGTWKPHAKNPVVTDTKRSSRPGGRPIVHSDHIYTFYQDDYRQYGDKIRGFEITTLTTSAFERHELPQSPLIEGTVHDLDKATEQWNSRGMHTYDPWYVSDEEGWLVSVDGQSEENDSWTVGIYRVEP